MPNADATRATAEPSAPCPTMREVPVLTLKVVPQLPRCEGMSPWMVVTTKVVKVMVNVDVVPPRRRSIRVRLQSQTHCCLVYDP